METDEPFKWPDDWKKVLPAVLRQVRRECAHMNQQDADAEEILAEVLFEIWNAAEGPSSTKPRDGFPTPGEVVAYGVVIARNYIFKRNKKSANRPKTSHVDKPDDLPSKRAPGTEFAELLDLIDDPLQRHAVQLRFEMNYIIEEIAGELGVSVGKAHNLVVRGLKAIKRRLPE
jgi:RNA polymerase sigma factor (sigma-70 family)